MKSAHIVTHTNAAVYTLDLNLPESWQELTPKQWAGLAEASTSAALELTWRRLALRVFGVPPGALARLSGDQIERLVELSGITPTPTPGAAWHIRRLLWKGPKEGLQGLSALRFGLADHHARKALNPDTLEKEKAEALRVFWACLFTPLALPWTPATGKAYQAFARLVPYRWKLAAAFNFLAVSSWFAQTFPGAHTSKSSKGPNFGWPGAFVALAGEKFGTPREVHRTPIMDVFIHMEQQAARE